MGWTRHTGTVVSLAALASVVANYAVHHHFQHRNRPQTIALDRPSVRSGPMLLDTTNHPNPDDFPRPIPRFLDGPVSGTVTPALQTGEIPAGEPRPVPAPIDPCPLANADEPANVPPIDSQSLSAVRKVIDEELADSSQEERDIWFEELKSIPAGVVRDLLQVRKQLRALPRALHRRDPISVQVPSVVPRAAELVTEPVSQVRRQPLPDWIQTVAALEQACAIARHNLANSETPGFKRLRVTMIDSYPGPWNRGVAPATGSGGEAGSLQLSPLQVEGCRVCEPILDLTEGTLLETGQDLDLAIDGGGFFQVKVGEQMAYTRCGAMVLNSQRHLCLAVSEDLAELQPVLAIPADASEIQVSADGGVRVLTPGNDPVSVGQLQLARFASPALLRPIGGTLLLPTEGSGDAELGAVKEQGRGAIQQGCLEQSNVNPDLESAAIEKWQALMKSFPASGRPVTASGLDQNAR